MSDKRCCELGSACVLPVLLYIRTILLHELELTESLVNDSYYNYKSKPLTMPFTFRLYLFIQSVHRENISRLLYLPFCLFPYFNHFSTVKSSVFIFPNVFMTFKTNFKLLCFWKVPQINKPYMALSCGCFTVVASRVKVPKEWWVWWCRCGNGQANGCSLFQVHKTLGSLQNTFFLAAVELNVSACLEQNWFICFLPLTFIKFHCLLQNYT